MNRLIIRISLRPNCWLLPYFWSNKYRYHIRHSSPPRDEFAFGHRLVWLFLDCELAILPKDAYWNPDGTHFQPEA
jgi:hypothetical protein